MARGDLFPWGDGRRFHSYGLYIRRRFGGRMQKLTIDAGFGCPHRPNRRGEGGCIYCNNEAFNPSYCAQVKSVRQQIEEGIAFHRTRYRRAEGYLAYFQAYTNTLAPVGHLRALYEEALAQEGVRGLVIGTRPDCLPLEVLDLLGELSARVPLMVELGAESMHDSTLRRIGRGHLSGATVESVHALHSLGIGVGLHMILGLPGEDRDQCVGSVLRACALPIDTIKLHQLQVLRGTRLAMEWIRDPASIALFGLDEYLDFLVDLVCAMPARVAIERVGAECPPAYLLAPHWGLVRNDELLRRFELLLSARGVWQGCRSLMGIG